MRDVVLSFSGHLLEIQGTSCLLVPHQASQAGSIEGAFRELDAGAQRQRNGADLKRRDRLSLRHVERVAQGADDAQPGDGAILGRHTKHLRS